MPTGQPHRAAWLALALLGAAACVRSRSAIPLAYIDQILADPPAHLGRPVRMDGVVEGLTSVTGHPSSYTLKDGSGRSVEVRARQLPEVGHSVRLIGQVAQDEANVLVPVIIEARRAGERRPSILAYGVLGISGAFFLLVLAVEAVGQLAGMKPRPLMEILPTLAASLGGEPAAKVPPRSYAEGDRFRFRILVGPDKGREIIVDRRRAYLGRGGSRRNDVDLRDATVSRRQAVICYSRKRKQVLLLNEAETNPTAVNGTVVGKGPLAHGDVLRMGHTKLQLFFEPPPVAVRRVPPPPPAPAPPALPAQGTSSPSPETGGADAAPALP